MVKIKFKKYAQSEYTDSLIYHRLSQWEKRKENKEMMEQLSVKEREHYEFWHRLEPDLKPYISFFFAPCVLMMRKIFGLTFIIKFLELHEHKVVVEYKKLLDVISSEHRDSLQKMINDEESHEQSLVSQIKEKRLSYIGFIALGLADAIVEITGVHAGFLGVTGSTLVAGISGVIVGFAAAISMASAAYLQAKNDTERSPFISALTTGISYIVSVAILALPYFITGDMLIAFFTSTFIGILLIAVFTFYSAIIFERKFFREFIESTFLMLGTALATFVLGKILGESFDLKSQGLY